MVAFHFHGFENSSNLIGDLKFGISLLSEVSSNAITCTSVFTHLKQLLLKLSKVTLDSGICFLCVGVLNSQHDDWLDKN